MPQLSSLWVLSYALAFLLLLWMRWDFQNVPSFPLLRSLHSAKSYKSHNMRYVLDSGVCETTPGVRQMSGYVEVGKNMSMWFWFFESRSSPETAPFTLWLNGGPGCSSMIGLFQENGPCLVNADKKSTRVNPYSWNSISNLIYIDQPIGTGFSYGNDVVNSTDSAAPFLWKAIEILFQSDPFSKYKNRELALASESYGGHYGPNFVAYFQEQNAMIRNGTIQGEVIEISTLIINNGWFDPLIQHQSYVEFGLNAPGYGQLQSDEVIRKANQSYYGPGGCKEQIEACYAAGNSLKSNVICNDADEFCFKQLYFPVVGDRDPDDLRQQHPRAFPPQYYVEYLALPLIRKRIGVEITYQECPDEPFDKFTTTGDDARSLLPRLSMLANSRLKILLWAGDADINCNWVGVYNTILAMKWYGQERWRKTNFSIMTIGEEPFAEIKNVDSFSFARVYQAGHELAAFQPKIALEIFKQTINKEQLHSI